MLETPDMQGTIEFYTNKLGFRLAGTHEDEGVLNWCALTQGNVWLMFRLSEPGCQPFLSGEFFIYLVDVDTAWDELKDKVTIIREIANMPYANREFTIRDNNGYLITLAQMLDMVSPFDIHFPSALTLETDRVQLRLLRREDIPELLPLTASATTWKYFTKDLSTETALEEWVAEALNDYGNQRRAPFAIIDKKENKIAGSTSFGNISFYDKRIEIGWSWLGDAFKGSGVNTHAKFLLMQYAFETLQFERVEIKTDNLNERAKTALHKVGAKPEGVLRSHMQMHSNRRRDSIYFAVLKDEWDQVRRELVGKLAG